MTCPKTNPNYPNTATSVAIPFGVAVRKADPGFDKERRFDRVYEFGRRVFKEDALMHGAYVPAPYDFDASFSNDFPTLDIALRLQNGFCGG